MEIRDPIHGYINPTPKVLQIINTFVFQRLRRIKQLALANLAYPGSNHTRFDHSLGVYKIASIMAESTLGNDADQKENIYLIQLAAILHDIGHPPFSHVSEPVLSRYYDYQAGEEKEKIHEKITMKLIEYVYELKSILSDTDRKNIIGILNGKKLDLSLMKEIVSGPIDADKMDYLLRDSYFCGVKYGAYDIERMINTFCSIPDGTDKHLGVHYDGINSLEQFLLAKYYMTSQVYYHKIRTLTDAMIVRGLILGIEVDDFKFLKDVFVYDESEAYFDRYLQYWDERVFIDLLYNNNKGLSVDIFKRLFERRLFTRIFSLKLTELKTSGRAIDTLIDINSKERDSTRKEIEKEISKLDNLKCKSEEVIINCFKLKSFSEVYNHSESEILIKNQDDRIQNFSGSSSVFAAIEETITETIIEVYAPLEYTDKREKKKKITILQGEILNIFNSLEVKK
jgi:uncharacterized protein